MSLVEHIRINVNEHGTEAYAQFTQVYEGVREHASMSLVRPIGTLKWKPLVDGQDILSEVRTEVRREVQRLHGGTPAGGVKRNFKRPTHERILPRVNAPAGVEMRSADAPPVTPTRERVTSVLTRPAPVVPDSCDCLPGTHTNGFTRGSGRWRSHALSFGCVGEPVMPADVPVAPPVTLPVTDVQVDDSDDFDALLSVAEGVTDGGADKESVNAVLRFYRRGLTTVDEALDALAELAE